MYPESSVFHYLYIQKSQALAAWLIISSFGELGIWCFVCVPHGNKEHNFVMLGIYPVEKLAVFQPSTNQGGLL